MASREAGPLRAAAIYDISRYFLYIAICDFFLAFRDIFGGIS